MTNNLKVLHPEIFDEIIHELYEKDLLNKLTFGSGRKLEWKCKDCSYRWIAVISDRTRKGNRASGCPQCKEEQRCENISKATTGNDLKTLFPELFKELDKVLNKDVDHLSFSSSKKVWWNCSKCSHQWNATVNGRTKKDRSRGCPQCANVIRSEKSSRATIGVNDLRTTHPELYSELHTVLNAGIDLGLVSFGSSQKLWWECSNNTCEKVWKTSPLKRSWQSTGCPNCADSNGTSKQEKELFDFIVTCVSDGVLVMENDRNTIKNPLTNRFLELDIHIPELGMAFEYNGSYWHSDENISERTNGVFKCAEDYHNFKTSLCEDVGIRLIHIRESDWINSNASVKSSLISLFL